MNLGILFFVQNYLRPTFLIQLLNMNCFLLRKFTVDSIYLPLNEAFSIEYTKITCDYGMIIIREGYWTLNIGKAIHIIKEIA